MKVLLVNPNNYKYPPVPPLGLEYLFGNLQDTKHELYFIDLCFSENPINELLICIKNFMPDVACITVRQTDTVLYRDNIFFLDNIQEYTTLFHQYNIKVILGGPGFSIMPGNILKYTNADHGISGSGDLALPYLLEDVEFKRGPIRIINGYKFFNNKSTNHSKRSLVSDYKKYTENGGIGGFRTQTGCYGRCFYCTESCKPVYYFSPSDIAEEINQLVTQGVNNFHLCDSEFNQDINHCKAVCKAIIEKCPPIHWTVYMKTYPIDPELFILMAQSGVSLITLSLDSKNNTPVTFDGISSFLIHAKKNNIKTVIDLSVGYPGDRMNVIKDLITLLDENPCESVGINSYYRLYPGTILCEMIENDPGLQKFILNPENFSNDFINPVFYNEINENELFKLTNNRTKFRVEGFDKTVNYLRV